MLMNNNIANECQEIMPTFIDDTVPFKIKCEFWLEAIELDTVCHELLESSDDDIWCSEKTSIDWFAFITIICFAACYSIKH